MALRVTLVTSMKKGEMPTMDLTVAVDLGKTQCRVRVMTTADSRVVVGPGAPGLATTHGVDAAAAAILPLLDRAEGIASIGVGAAGAWAAPAAAAALAQRLAEATGARVAVTSDVVTAHAGALDGGAGTLLIAGTGAAALGVDDRGIRLVDGWGPELGDFGGGSWIGREGVRAALRADVSLGSETVLTDLIRAHIAPSVDAVAWLSTQVQSAPLLATVAPIVLDAAQAGDAVALGIAAEAARMLTASAVAASTLSDVALHGGLTEHSWFRRQLEHSLLAAGRTIAHSSGDALVGAVLLASHRDLPHERFVHRAE